jgi:hypothetical protein
MSSACLRCVVSGGDAAPSGTHAALKSALFSLVAAAQVPLVSVSITPSPQSGSTGSL